MQCYSVKCGCFIEIENNVLFNRFSGFPAEHGGNIETFPCSKRACSKNAKRKLGNIRRGKLRSAHVRDTSRRTEQIDGDFYFRPSLRRNLRIRRPRRSHAERVLCRIINAEHQVVVCRYVFDPRRIQNHIVIGLHGKELYFQRTVFAFVTHGSIVRKFVGRGPIKAYLFHAEGLVEISDLIIHDHFRLGRRFRHGIHRGQIKGTSPLNRIFLIVIKKPQRKVGNVFAVDHDACHGRVRYVFRIQIPDGDFQFRPGIGRKCNIAKPAIAGIYFMIVIVINPDHEMRIFADVALDDAVENNVIPAR